MIFSLPARLPSLKRANLRFKPYAARDIPVRSQIIRLLLVLRERRDLSYLFIFHDMSVVRYMADRVGVW